MPNDVRIESYGGPRDSLRPLFELADDSAAALDSYIEAGRVLGAVSDGEVIGHLQLTSTGDPRQAEIKNMAVREDHQGHGVGRRLIQAAIDLAGADQFGLGGRVEQREFLVHGLTSACTARSSHTRSLSSMPSMRRPGG